MAQTTKKTTGKAAEQGPSLIDPVYEKFTRSVVRALGSNEFYQFFMDAIARADNEIQFSNRKEVKSVDLTWVEAVEDALEGFQQIVSLPRQEIREEELIVNVANAKRTGPDVVQHLARHASMVEDFDAEAGNVRPSHLMQKYREDSIGLYENRLVFTALESAYHFVKIRHDALFEAMSDEFGAKLKVRSDMESATEMVHMDLFLHIKNTESMLKTDEKNRETFDRISRLYRVLGVFMNTDFAKQLSRLDRVKGQLHKTNILKRNPSYRSVVKLFEFLRSYDQIGYTIKVVEQNPQVDETFQRDIFHNILFNYIVLKGYLEDEADRQVPTARKPKQRTLKPKFIHQIIEELTEDYDLPDVEIRKVLIEELTKEQLMQEEAAERRRLVEEQEARKKAEQERIKAEKKAEQERIKAEKAAERERIRQEKEAEARRALEERMAREAEDRRRGGLLRKEIERFQEHLEEQMRLRQEALEQEEQKKQDFADAVQLLEEAEQRKKEEAARERKRRQEERDRRQLEKARAEEAARQEAERQKELARLEAERLEQERLAEEERQREEQKQKDLAALHSYVVEINLFQTGLSNRLQMRAAQRAAMEERDLSRRRAIEQRAREKANAGQGTGNHTDIQ